MGRTVGSEPRRGLRTMVASAPSAIRDRLPVGAQDALRSLRDTLSPARRRAENQRRLEQDREEQFARRVSPQGCVLAGPFEGIRLPWRASSGSMVPLLAGSYEKQLWPAIERLIERQPPLVINVGAAEGYYAVGFAVRLPGCEVDAHDIDRQARRLCAETVRLNGVGNVNVRGRLSAEILGSRLVPGALVVADCEGFEVELLDPDVAPALATADLLVEIHEFLRPGVTELLVSRFDSTHDIELIDVVDRSPQDHRHLSHLSPVEAESAVREGRPTDPPMQWAVMTPRHDIGIGLA